jgi:hypothetical protein
MVSAAMVAKGPERTDAGSAATSAAAAAVESTSLFAMETPPRNPGTGLGFEPYHAASGRGWL